MVTVTFCLEREDDDVELTINGDVDPYSPANLSGHPDNWYPAEGGTASIIDILYQTDEDKGLTNWPGELTFKEIEEVEELLLAQAQEMAENAAEDAALDAYLDRYEDDYFS